MAVWEKRRENKEAMKRKKHAILKCSCTRVPGTLRKTPDIVMPIGGTRTRPRMSAGHDAKFKGGCLVIGSAMDRVNHLLWNQVGGDQTMLLLVS